MNKMWLPFPIIGIVYFWNCKDSSYMLRHAIIHGVYTVFIHVIWAAIIVGILNLLN